MIRLMRSQDDHQHQHHHYHHLHVDIDIIPHLLHLPLPKALHLPLHLLDHLKSVQVGHIGVLILLLLPVLVLLLVQIQTKHHKPIPSKNKTRQTPLLSIRIRLSFRTIRHEDEQIRPESKITRMGDRGIFIRNRTRIHVKTKIISENDLSEVVLRTHPFTRPLLDLLVLLDHTAPTAHMGHVGVI